MKNKKDLRILSEALDSKFTLGGFKFGYDGLIGLVPVVGDLFTMSLSMYIVFRAILMNYPLSIIIKMLMNIFVENIIGIIPLIGNVFDFVWKSNLKNIKLLDTFDANPTRTLRSTKLQLGLIFVFVLLFFGLTIYLIFSLAAWLFSLIF